MITALGAKALRAMIVSCGQAGCFRAIELLEAVTEDVPLNSIGIDEAGKWRMAAFARLSDYAQERGLGVLDYINVVEYFAGAKHIDIFSRTPDAGMGKYVGPYAGLVSHVLLPLDSDLTYRNSKYKVGFDGHTVHFNPEETGVPCYHLGVVVNFPLTSQEVAKIKAEQLSAEPFRRALEKISDPIVPPVEYWEALNCTVAKAAGK